MIDDLLDKVSDTVGGAGNDKTQDPRVSTVVIGDNNTVVIGDTGHRRRKEDQDGEEDDASHGRRASDRDLRRQVRELQEEVNTLRRMVEAIRNSEITYPAQGKRRSSKQTARRSASPVSNHAAHATESEAIHASQPAARPTPPAVAAARATRGLSRNLPSHPATSRIPRPSVPSHVSRRPAVPATVPKKKGLRLMP